MKVLVTGAAGFVGRVLVARLREAGHDVIGTYLAADAPPVAPGVRWQPLDVRDDTSVRQALAEQPDAVVHLAAVASSAAARRDPGLAWEVNAAGTARLAEALGEQRNRGADPLLLLVSTSEVYGAGVGGKRLRTEADPVAPLSPYAASKVGSEVAAQEVARRTGLRVMIARPFTHTGPGQAEIYVIPAFARRLREARAKGTTVIRTGNLAPVRDFLDVRDVAAAYVSLLQHGRPGEIYNVASGTGVALHAVFERLARLVGVRATAEPDPSLIRSTDVPHLVGDATRLRTATGWVPRISFEQTLQDVVNAQAD